MNRFAGMIGSSRFVPVLRSGARFQPAYVADAAEGIAAALADPLTHNGHTYELGGPDVITMGELQHWIARELGASPVFIEIADPIGALLAGIPFVPITGDQWRMLKTDTVVAPGAEGFAALGVHPTPLATVAPA